MSRDEGTRQAARDEDRRIGRAAARGAPSFMKTDTISEESSQESPRVSAERVPPPRRTSVGPINLALVTEQDSMIASLASPIGAERQLKGYRRASLPKLSYERLMSQGSSHSQKFEESGSLVSSEGIFSGPKRRPEGESSFYAMTPKDTEHSSFDSLSIAEDSSKRKLKQRLSIPEKTPPSRSIDSMRSVVRQDEYLKDFATYHSTFTDEEIERAFEEMDLDQNGLLTTEELRDVLDSIGEFVSDEVLEEMVRMVDVEGRGNIAFEEFYKMASGQSTAPIGGALPPNPNMKIVGMNQISWKKAGANRSHRTMTGASTESKSISQQKSVSPRTPAVPKPLKTFETVPKPAKKVKKLNIGAPGKPPAPPPKRAPVSMLGVEEPSRIAVTPPVSTLSPRETEYHTQITMESHQQDDRERNFLVNELIHCTIFTSQIIEKLVDIFRQTTGSEDGELDYPSFVSMINSRLPPQQHLDDDRVTKRIFVILDVDKSETLSVREFIKGLSHLRRPKDEEQFRFVFRVFDADDDGSISKNELIRILKLNAHTIHTDAQAQAKAEELLHLAGNEDMMTLEGFMKVKDKKLMLLAPVQERARKMAYIANFEDS